MKKILFILGVLLSMHSVTVLAQVTPKPVLQINSSMDGAMVVDPYEDWVSSIRSASVVESGNDATFTIYDDHLNVEKTFTLHGIIDEYTHIDKIWVESLDCTNIIVSKNFFVKNDKWCVATSKYKNGYDGEGFLTVYDEDGNNLGSFTVSEEPDIWLSYAYEGVPFLLITDYNTHSETLYTFTGESSVNPVVAMQKSAVGYPNPVSQGGTFTVVLGKEADRSTRFVVLDMNGRSVMSRNIKPGSTDFSLSNRFANGHYIFNVIYGDGTVESGRLLSE